MTNPNDGTDYFRISSFGPDTFFESGTHSTFLVTAKTFPGLSYTLEISSGLDFSVDLLPDLTFIATGFEETFQITFAGATGFVRLKRN